MDEDNQIDVEKMWGNPRTYWLLGAIGVFWIIADAISKHV